MKWFNRKFVCSFWGCKPASNPEVDLSFSEQLDADAEQILEQLKPGFPGIKFLMSATATVSHRCERCGEQI